LLGIPQQCDLCTFKNTLPNYAIMDFIIYFLYSTITILLVYNFLTTILFCFKKKLLSTHQNIVLTQKIFLVVIFFVMIAYYCKAEKIPTEMYLISWTWGFLTSHLFITRKKRWIHELLGLGILLAITIVLFFKQEEIIQVVTRKKIETIGIEITSIYLMLGLVLGAIFWPRKLYN